MSSTDTGHEAELAVVVELKKQDCKILAMNWRNRWCEIDIVCKDKKCVYFVEVKYRRSSTSGDGFEAITAQKLERMSRAAEAWVMTEGWQGPYELKVAAVTPESIEIRDIY